MRDIIFFYLSHPGSDIDVFFRALTRTAKVSLIAKLTPIAGSSIEAGAIFLQMDSATHCGTEVFKIDSSLGGAKEAYSAALSAMMAGKSLIIETDFCNGWGSLVRSLYIVD